MDFKFYFITFLVAFSILSFLIVCAFEFAGLSIEDIFKKDKSKF